MNAPLRFEIPIVKTLHKHKSNEQGKDKIQDRHGIMFETMIQRPVSHQGVE